VARRNPHQYNRIRRCLHSVIASIKSVAAAAYSAVAPQNHRSCARQRLCGVGNGKDKQRRAMYRALNAIARRNSIMASMPLMRAIARVASRIIIALQRVARRGLNSAWRALRNINASHSGLTRTASAYLRTTLAHLMTRSRDVMMTENNSLKDII